MHGGVFPLKYAKYDVSDGGINAHLPRVARKAKASVKGRNLKPRMVRMDGAGAELTLMVN